MNAPLYNVEILRLASGNPCDGRLIDPMGSAERRSPVCGSRVAVDINLDHRGRVAEVGMTISACAFGQASATLLARNAIGTSPQELAAVRDALTAWLGGGSVVPEWSSLAVFAPALPHSARHAAIRLAFETAADAAAAAARAPA